MRLDDLDALACYASPAFPDALSSGLFGDRASFDAVIVPQSADDLSGGYLPHVHADQPDYEHAITAKVVLGELGQYAGLALGGVERAQLLAEVLDVAGPVEGPEQPAQRIDGRDERQEDVPEPDEDEELLVEQVDGESTLDDVLVHVTEHTGRRTGARETGGALRTRRASRVENVPSATSPVRGSVVPRRERRRDDSRS